MEPTATERLSVRMGYAMMVGSLVQDRPWFPTLIERAMLVKKALPSWATASGTTAGWVWTGMGNPDPWCVLRPAHPEVSPLERTLWRARQWNPRHHEVTLVNGLSLLTTRSCVREILLGGADIDVSATQIMMLSNAAEETLRHQSLERRASATHRSHSREILERLAYLRATYPDITR